MPTAVLVPQTALLVPGVAGRDAVLPAVRAAAMTAVRALVAAQPATIAIIAPAARARHADAAELCASLESIGVAERWLEWSPACRLEGCPEHVVPAAPGVLAATATAVGLRLLAASGWAGPTTVLETALGADDETELLGSARAAEGLLVLGSLSARHGEGAPREADPLADDVDARLAADLAAPSREALERIAGIDPDLATGLDVGGAAPWSLLARCVSGDAVGRLEARDDSLGVGHAVWTWRWGR